MHYKTLAVQQVHQHEMELFGIQYIPNPDQLLNLTFLIIKRIDLMFDSSSQGFSLIGSSRFLLYL